MTTRELSLYKGIRLYLATCGLFIVVAIFGGCKVAHAADGFATYYTCASTKAEGNSGVLTASGAVYDESALTCAMRRRDWGSKFMVYGHETGKSVVVKLTDFGPGKGPARRGTIIDLTPAAFKDVCGDLKLGRCQVSVQEVRS